MPSSLLIWNRLEPQPRTNDLSVALRCEVRDALWMLARQWQMGEFRAEDAGACAFVKVQCESVFAQKLSLRGGEPQACSPEMPLNFLTQGIAPLETHSPVEGAPPVLSLDLRVELGTYWLRLLSSYRRQKPPPRSRRSRPLHCCISGCPWRKPRKSRWPTLRRSSTNLTLRCFLP
jgi:hypothetical protein